MTETIKDVSRFSYYEGYIHAFDYAMEQVSQILNEVNRAARDRSDTDFDKLRALVKSILDEMDTLTAETREELWEHDMANINPDNLKGDSLPF